MRQIGILLIALLLASCTTAGSSGSVVGWVRSPQQVIFRTDISASEDPWEYRHGVPNCAVYGDNRVVWTNLLDSSQYEVLYDRVSDEAIGRFVEQMTVAQRIYTYQSPEQTPAAEPGVPILQTVYIDVNGLVHEADETSGWSQDWYARVTEACRTISQTPVLFVPTGGWLTIEETPLAPGAPTWVWGDPAISLSEIAAGGQARWVMGDTAALVWTAMTTMPAALRFSEDGRYYRVALQVPGITRESPPAPQPS